MTDDFDLPGLDPDALRKISAVWNCNRSDFRSLIEAGDLDPKTDFKNGDFRGWNLSGEDVRGIDFTGSDLRGTGIDTAIRDEATILVGAKLDVGLLLSSERPNRRELEALSFDDLWSLHEHIAQILSVRLTSNKRELEKRLADLGRSMEVITEVIAEVRAARRADDKIRRKYRKPQTSETWSGRGKQPRWLIAAEEAGHNIEEFLWTGVDYAPVSPPKRRKKKH